MLIVRIYVFLWLLAALAGGILYLTGAFGGLITVIYGFIVHALAGAALLVVLPVMITERVATGRQARQS